MSLTMRMMLSEISEILPGRLYLSGGTAVTETTLAKLGITLVINVTKELPVCPLGEGVSVVKVAVEDSPGANLYRYFEVSRN